MQHDDHCIISFVGENWRITGMHGLEQIALQALDNPHHWTWLDLSRADLAAYVETACAWIEPKLSITNV